MPDTLSITLAQLNQRVGDIAGNAQTMLEVRKGAGKTDMVAFPEMQLIGYPPEDLVQTPALIACAQAELDKLARATNDGGPAMLVGSVFVRDGALHNGVALLDGGRVTATRFKHELPNYGTFDEMRLFTPGPLPEPVLFRGAMLGLPVCEDIWHPDVCSHLAEFGAGLFLSV
ncbi:MAG TPA: nitrilase-related carbon-nitrogen hydrolase, partial [Croceibacterium sp.]|nr:nitrilase-related carbon-nitrogen hydrolase [Croceibacterium sp.]